MRRGVLVVAAIAVAATTACSGTLTLKRPQGLGALVTRARERVAPHLTVTRLPMEPCEAGGQADARCGSYPVFEDRAARKGRVVAVHVVVLPATGPAPLRDPVLVLAGGPGEGSSALVARAAQWFAGVRRERDVVLVDLRGTGRSDPLACRIYRDPAAYFGDLIPAAAAAHCRDSLSQHADLRHYTTAAMAEDVDEIRWALGYEQVNLFATSYGARAALRYAHRFPERVRSMVLRAPAPADMGAPMAAAQDAERALRLLFADCAATADCAAAFPELAIEFDALLARFDRGGVSITTGGGQGALEAVTVSRGAFASAVAQLLRAPETAARLPWLIHQGYLGNLGPLFETMVQQRRTLDETLSWGARLAVTCAEDAPMLDTARAARDDATTFLGDYAVRQQLAACAGWPRPPLPDGFRTPVGIAVPALIISGALDPDANEEWGALVARRLPKARHVVARNLASAVTDGTGCADRVMTDFIARADTAGLDGSCLARLGRPVWVMR